MNDLCFENIKKIGNLFKNNIETRNMICFKNIIFTIKMKTQVSYDIM